MTFRGDLGRRKRGLRLHGVVRPDPVGAAKSRRLDISEYVNP